MAQRQHPHGGPERRSVRGAAFAHFTIGTHHDRLARIATVGAEFSMRAHVPCLAQNRGTFKAHARVARLDANQRGDGGPAALSVPLGELPHAELPKTASTMAKERLRHRTASANAHATAYRRKSKDHAL